MEPSKYPTDPDDSSWSDWVESVRKDVECFFGVLKGRVRLLKLPTLFRKKEEIYNAFFTCCTLHNMLHKRDGLDQLEEGAQWAGEDGLHDREVANPTADVSSIGVRDPIGNDEADEIELSHDDLKKQLIDSFRCRTVVNSDIRLLRR